MRLRKLIIELRIRSAISAMASAMQNASIVGEVQNDNHTLWEKWRSHWRDV